MLGLCLGLGLKAKIVGLGLELVRIDVYRKQQKKLTQVFALVFEDKFFADVAGISWSGSVIQVYAIVEGRLIGRRRAISLR